MAEEVTGCDHGFGWIVLFFYFCESVVVLNIYLDVGNWKDSNDFLSLQSQEICSMEDSCNVIIG